VKAVILAAGKGTRLGDLSLVTPKAMVPLRGRPVLHVIIEHIAQSGVGEFVVVVGYLADQIKDYFGDGSAMGLSIEYAEQPTGRYGTGAALAAARNVVCGCDILLTFADVVTSGECYKGAIETLYREGCDGVITVNRLEDPWRGASVVIDDSGLVLDIVEKPPKGRIVSHWNSSGVFAFRPAIFDYIDRLTPSSRGEYEIGDAMVLMAREGLRIRPNYYDGAWKDVGTPEDIAAAEKLLGED